MSANNVELNNTDTEFFQITVILFKIFLGFYLIKLIVKHRFFFFHVYVFQVHYDDHEILQYFSCGTEFVAPHCRPCINRTFHNLGRGSSYHLYKFSAYLKLSGTYEDVMHS